jgi:hypothetical protein
MADQRMIILRAGHANATTIVLSDLPARAGPTLVPIVLRAKTSTNDIYLYSDSSWPSSGITNYTITIGDGSYTLTGQDVSIVRAITITAASGSYTLTGQDVSLVRAITLTASAGTYTVAGQDVSLFRNSSITIDAGTYTVTGANTTLRSMQIQWVQHSGSIYVPTSNVLASYPGPASAYETWTPDLIAAKKAVIGIDGTTSFLDIETGDLIKIQDNAFGQGNSTYTVASVQSNYTMLLSSGYSFSPATTNAYLYTQQIGFTIPLATGTYTVTGQDVSFLRTYVFPIDAGSYTLTGQDVSVGRELTLTADQGTYTLTGQDASLVKEFYLSPSTGTYSLSGRSVTVGRVLTLALASGSYSLSGEDASFLRDYLIDVV